MTSEVGWDAGPEDGAIESPFFQSAIDALPANVAILDPAGAVTHVNDGWRRFAVLNHHVSPDQLIGENYLHVCERASGPCSEGAGAVAEALRDLLAGGRETFEWEYPCHSPTEQRWFRLRAKRFEHRGRNWAALIHTNDTARCLAEQARSLTTSLFRAAMEATLDAFVLLTPICSEHVDCIDFEVADANPRAEAMLRRSRAQLVGSRWTHQLKKSHDAGLFQQLIDASTRGTTEQLDLHLPLANWAFDWVNVQVVPCRSGLACFFRDITPRKSLEAQLRAAACTDDLTQLPNRRAVTGHINTAIAAHKAELACRYALLFLDFDHFKLINDSLGHDVGDAYLVQIGNRLQRVTKDLSLGLPDTVNLLAGRLGGDEFILCCQGVGLTDEHLQTITRTVLEVIGQPIHLADQTLEASASIGVTTSDHPCDRAEQVLRDADVAMYHAKAAGRGCAVWFDRTMQEAVAHRLRLESDLRAAATTGDDFQLHFQPIVGLSDGCLVGFEALIRWNHPTLGRISPDQFIPIAEETGLIQPIGRWVLGELLRIAPLLNQRWPQSSLRLHANLSPRQFSDTALVDTVRSLLEQSGIDPRRLVLELTESTIVDQPDVIADTLGQLKSLGVTIAMDDFGKGISSLAGLHRLPIDLLKIDRAFVHSLSERRDYAAVIQAIVTLAHNLGLAVVAEGIETSEQLVALQALDTDEGQGYLFARPMPVTELLQWDITARPATTRRIA